MVTPVEPEPAHILLDGLGVFDAFLLGVRIIETQVALAAMLFGNTEIKADRLGVSDVQVAVGLRWEPGRDAAVMFAAGHVLGDNGADKIE